MGQLKATALAPHMLLHYLAQLLHAHVASCQCKACAGAGPAPVCSGSCGGSYWGAGHAAVTAGSHAGSLPVAASYNKRAVLAELFSAAYVQGVCALRAYQRAQGSALAASTCLCCLVRCVWWEVLSWPCCVSCTRTCVQWLFGEIVEAECWIPEMLNTFCCM